jgi:hypothetical protein
LSEVVQLLKQHKGGDTHKDQAPRNTLLDEYIRNPRDGKLLLRQAMSRLLPEEITTAGKQGFSAPDAAWFRRESLAYVRHSLEGPESRVGEFLDRNAVRVILDEHMSGRANRRLLIWSLLNVEFLCRSFLPNQTTARPTVPDESLSRSNDHGREFLTVAAERAA